MCAPTVGEIAHSTQTNSMCKMQMSPHAAPIKTGIHNHQLYHVSNSCAQHEIEHTNVREILSCRVDSHVGAYTACASTE